MGVLVIFDSTGTRKGCIFSLQENLSPCPTINMFANLQIHMLSLPKLHEQLAIFGKREQNLVSSVKQLSWLLKKLALDALTALQRED